MAKLKMPTEYILKNFQNEPRTTIVCREHQIYIFAIISTIHSLSHILRFIETTLRHANFETSTSFFSKHIDLLSIQTLSSVYSDSEQNSYL